jgi:hypothetical protein
MIPEEMMAELQRAMTKVYVDVMVYGCGFLKTTSDGRVAFVPVEEALNHLLDKDKAP